MDDVEQSDYLCLKQQAESDILKLKTLDSMLDFHKRDRIEKMCKKIANEKNESRFCKRLIQEIKQLFHDRLLGMINRYYDEEVWDLDNELRERLMKTKAPSEDLLTEVLQKFEQKTKKFNGMLGKSSEQRIYLNAKERFERTFAESRDRHRMLNVEKQNRRRENEELERKRLQCETMNGLEESRSSLGNEGETVADSIERKLIQRAILADFIAGTILKANPDIDTDVLMKLGNPKEKVALLFHQIHNKNVNFNDSREIACRKSLFCKGIVFSNRPIAIDEIICVKIRALSTFQFGSLRIGITNDQPESFLALIKRKNRKDRNGENLSSSLVEFAKEIVAQGTILHFSFDHNGDVHYGVNGLKKGKLSARIDPQHPAWFVVEIYGNTVSVEMIDGIDAFRAIIPRAFSSKLS